MDRNGDNTPFSFQRLLFEDDWHRWDTYSTVDTYAVSPDLATVVYLDIPQIMFDYLMALNWEETPEEYWLQRQLSINERSEAASQEEYDIYPTIFTPEEMEFVDEYTEYDSTGLNVELLDKKIKRVKYESCNDGTKKCVICMYKLKYSEEVSKLKCGHEFHFGCIKNWLMVKNECSLCKQKAVSRTVC